MTIACILPVGKSFAAASATCILDRLVGIGLLLIERGLNRFCFFQRLKLIVDHGFRVRRSGTLTGRSLVDLRRFR